jgi:hypothetical protein
MIERWVDPTEALKRLSYDAGLRQTGRVVAVDLAGCNGGSRPTSVEEGTG